MVKKPEQYRIQRAGNAFQVLCTWGLMDVTVIRTQNGRGVFESQTEARQAILDHAKGYNIVKPIILT